MEALRENAGRVGTRAAAGGELALLCGIVRLMFRLDLAPAGSIVTCCKRAESELMPPSSCCDLADISSGDTNLDLGGVLGGVDAEMGVSRLVGTLEGARLANVSSRFGMLKDWYDAFSFASGSGSSVGTKPRVCGRNKAATKLTMIESRGLLRETTEKYWWTRCCRA